MATMIFLFGFGFTVPSTLSAALEDFPHMAGTASALYGFCSQTTAAIIGVMVGFFYNHTIWPMAIGMALPAMLAFIFWLLWIGLEKHEA